MWPSGHIRGSLSAPTVAAKGLERSALGSAGGSGGRAVRLASRVPWTGMPGPSLVHPVPGAAGPDSSSAGEYHRVLVGAIGIARAPDRLEAVVGGCLALVLFDPFAGIAGMAHVLLPDSGGAPAGSPGKYADLAVPALIEALVGHGARLSGLQAQLVGGARLFGAPGADSDIGSANANAVSAAVAIAGIPVVRRDVGGASSRKVQFEIATGRTTVSTCMGATTPGAHA